ncbi:MAG: hypothetical protein V4654_00890 [Bdellovibrionota bacterium]
MDTFLIWLFSFFTLHFCLIKFANAKFINQLSKSKNSIIILDTPKNLIEYFIYGIEYVIFCRYSFCGYKNYVRSNLRIFSAISLTAFLGIFINAICIVFGQSVSFFKVVAGIQTLDFPLLASAIAFCISTFILERSHLHKKWEFLANLQNKILETDLGLKREILETTLTLHLIEMEMWSHKSFVDKFNVVMTSAVFTYKQADPINNQSIFFKKNTGPRHFDKATAYDVVIKYKNILLERQKHNSRIDDLINKMA